MKFFALLVALFSISSPAFSDDLPNYCLDPQTNSEWAGLLSKNPNDDLVTKLFALRIGLCELVQRNIITLDRATDLFELERGKALKEREKELKLQNNKKITS